MKALIRVIRVLIVVYLCLPVAIHGQADVDCSEEGIAKCAASNQTCFVVTTTTDEDESREICRACPRGLLLWKNQTCISLDELDIEEYINAFEPLFIDATISLAKRLEFLKRTAQLVVDTNAADKPFTLRINEFSAESFDERRKRNGYRYRENAGGGIEPFVASSSEDDGDDNSPPLTVDWVAAGAVTVVKNQWSCGCCWSISAAGAIEGKAAIDANLTTSATTSKDDGAEGPMRQPSYSFQQMISCNDENSGCDGGSVIEALQYAHTNSFGGLATWVAYPYQDRSGTTTDECELTGKRPAIRPAEPRSVVDMQDRRSSFSDRLRHMKEGLVEQPVAVVLRGECDLLYAYQGGVLTEDGDCACDKPSCIDHAVLMVGYNDTHDPPYLLIKNSWGISWGEGGYFRIAQKESGTFGLFGILAEGVFPSTNTEFEEADDSLQWWKILLISLAVTAVLALVMYALEALWKQGRAAMSGQQENDDGGGGDDDEELPSSQTPNEGDEK